MKARSVEQLNKLQKKEERKNQKKKNSGYLELAQKPELKRKVKKGYSVRDK